MLTKIKKIGPKTCHFVTCYICVGPYYETYQLATSKVRFSFPSDVRVYGCVWNEYINLVHKYLAECESIWLSENSSTDLKRCSNRQASV
jgi:hypothetical protein